MQYMTSLLRVITQLNILHHYIQLPKEAAESFFILCLAGPNR